MIDGLASKKRDSRIDFDAIEIRLSSRASAAGRVTAPATRQKKHMELTPETAGRDKGILEPHPRPTGDVHPGSNGHGPNGSGTDTAPLPWSPEKSSKLYGISNWGQGYFSVN